MPRAMPPPVAYSARNPARAASRAESPSYTPGATTTSSLSINRRNRVVAFTSRSDRLSRPIFLDRAAGKRDAVTGTIRNPELAVLARRQSLEEIWRRPVDELDQEAVRQRADHVERELMDHVRRDGDLVGGGQVADLQRLAETVGPADVRHQVARGPPLEQFAELEARVVVLAGR